MCSGPELTNGGEGLLSSEQPVGREKSEEEAGYRFCLILCFSPHSYTEFLTNVKMVLKSAPPNTLFPNSSLPPLQRRHTSFNLSAGSQGPTGLIRSF